MVNTENPGIQAIDVWRKLSDFTPAIVSNPDNDATWVSMHNITGRGTWISIMATVVVAGANRHVEVRYNIDGAGLVAFDFTDTIGVNSHFGSELTMLVGFDVSLIVDMRLSAATSAQFLSVAIVE